MNYLIILFSLVASSVSAQTILKFDKKFVECEDKWVAYKMDEDSTYPFGFIYIDTQAGLTLNSEGKFRINKDGKFIPEKRDSFNLKIRLEPNRVLVAFIPESKFEDLNIKAVPEWLKYYKADTNSIERLFRLGYLYNSWNKSDRALTYLERAQKINPKFKGLEFELGYAYNALEQYEKAIIVLGGALETLPNECYLYKELSYAEMHLGQLDKASETCRKGIPLCSESAMKCELAYNLTYQYYKIKDKEKFKEWAKITEKYSSKGDQFIRNIEKMRAALK